MVFVARTRAPLVRYLTYLAALVVALVAELILLERLGGGLDWAAGLRGLAIGLVFALICDVLVQIGRRLGGWPGAIVAGLVAAAHPVALGPGWIDRIIYPAEPGAVGAIRPPLALMTSLPIVWGGDIAAVLQGRAEPAQAYRWLDRHFALAPIDSLEPGTLAPHRLLLLAQPRALAPAELVALDAWVRGGGRTLILSDPTLVWESGHALGDPRAPPPIGLLGPLLAHWGLTLDPRDDGAPLVVEAMPDGSQLATASPGRLGSDGSHCAIGNDGLMARCRVGVGRALMVADADLLDDRLWMGEGDDPAGSGRIADNMLLVTRWLDSLAGVERPALARPIAWIAPEARLAPAFGWASLPILLCLGAAAVIRRRARVSSRF